MQFNLRKKVSPEIAGDPRKLRDIIADQCETKEMSVADLVKKTGAQASYIDALSTGNTRNLPAFPYMRTQLIKIAQVLGLPPELLTKKYRTEFAAMHSGADDRLPSNRFALPTYRRPYLIGIGILALLLVLYVVTRSGFFGQPSLAVTIPPEAPSPFITTSATIAITGRTDPGDSVLINGQHVAVAVDGTFFKGYQLLPEINIISFSAKRFLGRSVTVTRQVYYEEQISVSPPVTAPAVPESESESGAEPTPTTTDQQTPSTNF